MSVADFEAVAPTADDFAVVCLPDPHLYDDTKGGYFADQMDWIVANQEARNIQMVLIEGDAVTDASVQAQWDRVTAGLTTLQAAGIPYLACPGNHDYVGDFNGRNITGFVGAFPAATYSGAAWFDGGFYEGNPDNVYTRATIGGRDYLFLAIEYDPRAAVLAWAKGIVEAHPNRLCIVVTHYFIDQNGAVAHPVADVLDALAPAGNVILVASGHVTEGSEASWSVLQGNCRRLNAFLANYQSIANDGTGTLRIVSVKPGVRAMLHETYSPTLNAYQEDADSKFVQTW